MLDVTINEIERTVIAGLMIDTYNHKYLKRLSVQDFSIYHNQILFRNLCQCKDKRLPELYNMVKDKGELEKADGIMNIINLFDDDITYIYYRYDYEYLIKCIQYNALLKRTSEDVQYNMRYYQW